MKADSSGTQKPRLILVDDHRMFVDSLRESLAAAYDVVAVAYDGASLLKLLETRSADCLLLDLQLPDRNGIGLIPDILSLRPALRILIVTMFVDRCLADAALAAGAHGFIPKDGSREELEKAIADVLAGLRHISPRVPKTSHRTSLEALHPAAARLTPRQQEVFRLLGDGKHEAEIARAIGISAATVTFHKLQIGKALGITTRSELVRFAVLVRSCVQDAAKDSSSGPASPLTSDL